MKKQENLEKEFLSEVKKLDLFTIVNNWKVLQVSFSYKSTSVVLGLKGHTDYRLFISYDGRRKDGKFRTDVETCGPFDPCGPSDYCESSVIVDYYKAVGSLLNHKDLLADLKKTMKKYCEMYEPEDDEE